MEFVDIMSLLTNQNSIILLLVFRTCIHISLLALEQLHGSGVRTGQVLFRSISVGRYGMAVVFQQ